MWHVDESPSPHTGGFEAFKSQNGHARAPTQDAITSVCASDKMLLLGRESGTVLRCSVCVCVCVCVCVLYMYMICIILGRESGTVRRYALPHTALEAKCTLWYCVTCFHTSF